jgi:hypothetical protein
MSLEDVVEGNFTARGTNRIRPGQPAERLFCRFAGSRTDDSTHLAFEGRCATASQSSRVRIDLSVIAPGTRYEMVVRAGAARLHGYKNNYPYAGVAAENHVSFSAPFELEGRKYQSTVQIFFGQSGVNRIAEVVTDRTTGDKSTLIDLNVTRKWSVAAPNAPSP